MKVAVYLRISKDHSGEALGVDRQREDCLAYLARRPDWNLVRVYTDNDVSATKLNRPRPQFEEMLRAVQAGEIDVIVSKHLDRLLRRLSELERVFKLCEQAGAYLVTVSDGVDTSNDGGRLVARILASVAQGEVERKGARQKRAMKQRAERGIGWGGRAFGYKVGDTGLVTREANAIRRAYSQVLSGKNLTAIAGDWNRRGLRTTKGDGNPWKGQTVKLVLINPRYAGLCSHKGEIVGKANWPPIVDEEIWESVRLLLTDPARDHSPADKSLKYLLTNMIYCGVCGGKLTVGGREGRRLYSCKNPGCYKIGRHVGNMDTIITDIIKARLARPDAAQLFIEPDRDIRHLYDELKTKRAKLDQIAIDYADDILTREQARIATSRLETRIEELQREISLSAKPNDFNDFDPEHVEKWFDALPLDRKRALIGMLCTVVALPVGKGWRKEPVGFAGIDFRWRVDD